MITIIYVLLVLSGALLSTQSGYFNDNTGQYEIRGLKTDETVAKLSFSNDTVFPRIVFAGQFLNFNPKVILLNVNNSKVIDSEIIHRRVKIYLLNNPANAQLYPQISLISSSLRGEVVFSSLRIDKVGVGYRFGFLLEELSPNSNHSFVSTNITIASPYFTVKSGNIANVKLLVRGDGAWAGGQPMQTQPILETIDFGGNRVIVNDSFNSCSLNLVESPGSKRIIRVVTQPIKVNVSSKSTNTSNIPSILPSLSPTTLTLKPTISPQNTSSERPYILIATISVIKPLLSTYYPDDIIFIQVNFTDEVYSTCSPVLVLRLLFENEAQFVSGNRSSSWLFRYTVSIGDSSSDGIYLRYFPNAFCYESRCSIQSTNCNILPVKLDYDKVDITIPQMIPHSKTKGFLISNSSIQVQPGSTRRNTSLMSVSTRLSSGVYGAGTRLYLDLTFTDVVMLRSSNFPRIFLNLKEFAIYSGGSNSKVLTFVYVTKKSDYTEALYLENIPGSNTPIDCQMNKGCILQNRIGGIMDISNISNDVWENNSIITLDSSIPFITDVFVWKNQLRDYFTIGDFISIDVKFSNCVFVSGALPYIQIVNKDSVSFALYNPEISNCFNLIFQYVVQPFDDMDSLLLYDTSINLNDNSTHIFLRSDLPEVQANVTFLKRMVFINDSSGESNVVIKTSNFPIAQNVTLLNVNPDKIYNAGDVLLILMVLSDYVVLTGRPYILLNCGKYARKGELVSYKYNDNYRYYRSFNYSLLQEPTRYLLFQYIVSDGDSSKALEYIDRYSIFPGHNQFGNDGKIYLASDSPKYEILLILPTPGSPGSMSYLNKINVDGSAPYITSIDFINPEGQYGKGDTILISLNFNKRITVVGNPYILLQVGDTIKSAEFVSHTPNATLIFQYIIEEGDNANHLDYFGASKDFNSAADSFQYNNSRIFTSSMLLLQEVYIRLNPPGGNLGGSLITEFNTEGVATFTNVYVTNMGRSYNLKYSCFFKDKDLSLSVDQNLEVSFSSEYQISSNDYMYGTMSIGHVVSIEDNFAVVGAPAANFSITSIQEIITSSTVQISQPEIILVYAKVSPRPLIQSFHTTADIGSIVSGFFTIAFSSHGVTRPIPSNADQDMLASILAYDIPSLGSVVVDRQPYVFCACYEAYNWTITFNDLSIGNFELLTLNGSLLTGSEAIIVGPYLIQSSAALNGTFSLSFEGTNLTSRPISFEADSHELSQGLSDLGLSISYIDITPSHINLGHRSWSITFNSFNGTYAIPILTPAWINYQGSAIVWIEVLQSGLFGPNGLTGFFILEWKKFSTSPLPSDISAIDLKNELELLPDIIKVNVTRKINPSCLGYIWNVEFVLVGLKFDNGSFIVDSSQEIPLLVAHNNLKGENASIKIKSIRDGNYGNNTGRIYVFQKYAERWVQVESLKGNDSTTGDNFGYSVSISGRYLAVGAIYARQISNDAPSGAVYLFESLNIDNSSSIQYSLSCCWLQIYKVFPTSYTGIEKFGNSVSLYRNLLAVGCPGCYDNRGSVYIFQDYLSNNNWIQSQEILNVNHLGFGEGFGYSISVSDISLVIGCPFSRNNSGSAFVSQKKAVLHFFGAPVELMTPFIIFDGSTFGYSVSLSGKYIAIGSPNFDDSVIYLGFESFNATSSGAVFIFEQEASYFPFSFLQKLNTSNVRPQDCFGFSVSISEDAVIIVSSLEKFFVEESISFERFTLRGLSHVFMLGSNGYFMEELFLFPNSYQIADRCGTSVSVSKFTAIVGCPNRFVNNYYSGAAMIYDLNLLRLSMNETENGTTEGSPTLVVVTNITSLNQNIYFYARTIDRNANVKFQDYFSHLYGITVAYSTFPLSTVDVAGISGLAMATYWSNSSNWIDGMFDYRGISDYESMYYPYAFSDTDKDIKFQISTTNDSVLEKPNEFFAVVLNSPGIWPSPLGNLYKKIEILESHTGNFDNLLVYNKLYSADYLTAAGFGTVIKTIPGIIMISAPMRRDYDNQIGNGKVYYYKQNISDVTYIDTLKSPVFNTSNGKSFGSDIALSNLEKFHTSICAVSEPLVNLIHIFISSGKDYKLRYHFDVSLQGFQGDHPEYKFGEKGSLALYENVLVVGAAGLETIFIFMRKFSINCNCFEWSPGTPIHSSEYQYDVVISGLNIHQQGFGTAVAIYGRYLIVGAPYADYDKLGSSAAIYNWDTEGESIESYGKGKVYVYYSQPAQQLISINAFEELTSGTFKLIFSDYGILNQTTQSLNVTTSSRQFKWILQNLSSIGTLDVSSSIDVSSEGYFCYSWKISYISKWENPPLLYPIWYNHGCQDCEPFAFGWIDPSSQVEVTRVENVSMFEERQIIAPGDRRSGDRFGISISLSENYLVVGSPYSASIATTSWDFESGNLEGWFATGTAFDYQPTYSENSLYREASVEQCIQLECSIRGSPSGMRGLYYIGTYEMRPGNISDFQIPDLNFAAGNFQGDEPQGSLTSNTFLILGTRISFLIGGGCNINNIYIELVVDGISVAKETGNCNDFMTQKYFPVESYLNRTGFIRIVDYSSTLWGHINVDDIHFDWDIYGASMFASNNHSVHVGNIETPCAGAAYVYSVNSTIIDGDCIEPFNFVIKLGPSDKRSNMYFGSFVTVDNDMIAINAPGAIVTGFYKELILSYPFNQSNFRNMASGLDFPLNINFSYFPPLPNEENNFMGAPAVWIAQNSSNFSTNVLEFLQGGAVYLYYHNQKFCSDISCHNVPMQPTESVKLQAFDEVAKDWFGSSIGIGEGLIVVGSPGNDGMVLDGGSAYLFGTPFQCFKFEKDEYIAIEGSSPYIAITVLKSTDDFCLQREIVLQFSTSDLSAKGVDKVKFEECLGLAPQHRYLAGCGDYERTSQILTILERESSSGFRVPILDNTCRNVFDRFIQITVSIPGSSALQGSQFYSTIRIDDDDFGEESC